MTEPFDRSAVVSFAELPVIPPPSAIDLDQVVLNMTPALRSDAHESLVDAHFMNAGHHHADLLVERLIYIYHAPNPRPPDISGAVRAYETATGQAAAEGVVDEQRVANQRTYVAALCNELARQANNYSSGFLIGRDGSETSRSLQEKGLLPTPGLQPLEKVSQLADEMRAIARSLSAAAGVVCPTLQDYDWARGEEQQAQEAAERLAPLIDKLAVLTALPQLDRVQATSRRISDTARVAAQIATVHAATTPAAVNAALDDDRKKILSNLLLDVPSYNRSSIPDRRPPGDLRRAADRYLTRLSHPTASGEEITAAEANARAEMAKGIAKLHMRDPDAVRALPPVQAGIVREVVAAVEATPGLLRELSKSNLTLVRPHIDKGHTTPMPGRPRG
jgi:hypothetical protein